MIDATSFPDPEEAVVAVLKAAMLDVFVANYQPEVIDREVVTVNVAGGGSRSWAEASMNVGVNVFALTEVECRALVARVQDVLASASNGEVLSVTTPVGAASVVRQTPPFQRYFSVTVYLKGLEDLS